MKKLSILFLSIILLSSNVFAEAAIIWAPTKTPELKEIKNENKIGQEAEIISPASSVNASLHSDPSMTDYSGVHNLYEDSNGNLYCKLSNNQYVKNAWRKINIKSFEKYGSVAEGFNHDYIWAYFGSNGRITKASSGKMKRYIIDNKPYAFNEYGQMLEGYFNDEGEMWDGRNDSDPFELLSGNNYLYYADPNNGILHNGWLKYNDFTDKYEWKDNIWLYFNPSNYRCIKSNSDTKYKLQKIGSKQFAFDSNGVMLTGLDAMKYDLEDGQSIKYFNADGSVVLNGFVKLNWEDEIVEENFSDYDNYDEDISIYLNKSGKMYKNMIKKIGSDYYGFDTNGVVLKNCLGIYGDSSYIDNISYEDTNGKEFILTGKYTNKNGDSGIYNSSYHLYYFDNSGKRKNSATLEFSDEKYSFEASNSGANENSKNGYFYVHGIRLKPIDVKYGIYIQNPENKTYSSSELYGNSNVFVVNSTGKKMSSGVHKDEDDRYWVVSSGGYLQGVYNIKIKQGYFYSTSANNKEEWIPFGTKDKRGKTEKDYLVRLYNEHSLNFKIQN